MRFLYIFVLVFSVILFSHKALAEGNWNVYTDCNRVYDMSVNGQTVWCATSGGVVRWNEAGGSALKYTSLDGLPGNFVTAITIDHSGAVWCGGLVWSGIASFDGSAWKFHPVDKPDDLTIYDLTAKEIAVDKDNNLWIAASRLWFFDIKTGKYYRYEMTGPVNALAFDGENILWLGTDKGATSFDGTAWKTYTEQDGLADNHINTVAVDKKGVKWFGTPKGVTSFDGIVWKTFNQGNSLIPGPVYDISFDAGNNAWFGTTKGLFYFDGVYWKSYTPENSGLEFGEVDGLTINDSGHIWFFYNPNRASPGGITRFNGQDWRTFTLEGPLSNNVWSIGIDLDNTLWVSTFGGTSTYDGKTWKQVIPPGAPSNYRFNAFCVDRKGVRWFGSGGGIHSFDDVNWTVYTTSNSGLKSNNIYSIYIDGNNTKWFGTPEGVCRFDGNFWKAWTKSDGLADNMIWEITADAAGTIWVGTEGGISSFDGSAWKTYTDEKTFFGKRVRDIAVDRDNVLWLCSPGEGIAIFDGIKWMTYTVENSGLSENQVNRIAVDRDNIKWFSVGFAEPCLMSFDGKAWKRYTEQDGLVSAGIQKIAVDGNNLKWFATDWGVGSFDDQKTNTSASIQASHDLPEAVRIIGNYPNPFNPKTAIEFVIPRETYVILTLYSLTGQKVRELVSTRLSAGSHTVIWDGKDETGKFVSTGVYLSRLTADGHVTNGKMLLVK
jgi:ligand-binding sensor domain-containing protein